MIELLARMESATYAKASKRREEAVAVYTSAFGRPRPAIHV
jgi:hypothetical protein